MTDNHAGWRLFRGAEQVTAVDDLFGTRPHGALHRFELHRAALLVDGRSRSAEERPGCGLSYCGVCDYRAMLFGGNTTSFEHWHRSPPQPTRQSPSDGNLRFPDSCLGGYLLESLSNN